MSVAHDVLDPYAVGHEGQQESLQLSMGEGGEADVYLSSPTNITFTRFGGAGVMDLVSALLQRLDAVLVLPGGTVILQRDGDRAHLAPFMRDEWSVVVARTGAEITQAIRAS
ncbi:hypothetical protein [Streptomyces sp. NPDC001970]